MNGKNKRFLELRWERIEQKRHAEGRTKSRAAQNRKHPAKITSKATKGA